MPTFSLLLWDFSSAWPLRHRPTIASSKMFACWATLDLSSHHVDSLVLFYYQRPLLWHIYCVELLRQIWSGELAVTPRSSKPSLGPIWTRRIQFLNDNPAVFSFLKIEINCVVFSFLVEMLRNSSSNQSNLCTSSSRRVVTLPHLFDVRQCSFCYGQCRARDWAVVCCPALCHSV